MNSMWVKKTVPLLALKFFCKEKAEKEEEAWRSEVEGGVAAAATAAIGKNLSNC